MASQYSVLRQYGKYISPYNIEMIAQGMGYMQQKVDANRQAINDYADYIINADILKPQDREHLQNKLNGLVSDVNNKYRKANLASDGIAREIQSRLGEALDTQTMNAIAGTREYRSFVAKIEDMKLNNPKQYSPINESMALMPFANWYNDGKVGSRMEPLHYTPYTDYNAEIDVKVKDFISKHKGQKIQEPVVNEKGERTGEVIETTMDEMPYSKIRSIVAASISQNGRAQMQLEGQYMALTNPQMFTQESTQAFVERYVSDFDVREKALKAELAGVGNDSRRKKLLENGLYELRTQRQQVMDEASSFIGQDYDPQRAGMFVVQQEFLRGAAMRWSYNNSTVTRKADDFYYKEAERLTTNAKFAWQQKIDEEKLKVDKLNAEANLIKANKSEDKSGGSGSSGRFGTSAGVGASYTVPVTQDDVKPSMVLMDNIAMNANNVSTDIQVLKNAMGETAVSDIMAYMKTNPKEFEGLSEDDAFMKFLTKNGGAAYDGLNNRDAQAAYLSSLGHLEERSANQKRYGKALKARQDVLRSGYDEAVVKSMNEDPGIDIFTDDKIVNLGDLKNMRSVKIGGKDLDPIQAAKVSSLMADLSKTIKYENTSNPGNSSFNRSGDAPITPRKIVDTAKASFLLDDINEILGSDLTLSDLDSVLHIDIYKGLYVVEGKSVQDKLNEILGDENKTKLAVALLSNIGVENGLPLRYKWSRSNSVASLIKDADNEAERVIDSQYDEFGRKAWLFNSSAPAKSEEKRIYTGLESIFTRSGGVLANDREVGNNHTLSPEQDGDGNWWIVADSGKSKKERVPVTASDLASVGYTVYTQKRTIPAESYETAVIPVTFAPPSSKEYGRTVMSLGYGPFATADNAKSYMDSSVLAECPDTHKREMDAIVSGVIKGASSYEIKAKGYKGIDDVPGIEISVYKAGTAGDPSTRPLTVVDMEGLAYANDISTAINIVPQAYLMIALEESMRREINAINANPSRTGINEDLANLIEVVRPQINEILNSNQNGNREQ